MASTCTVRAPAPARAGAVPSSSRVSIARPAIALARARVSLPARGMRSLASRNAVLSVRANASSGEQSPAPATTSAVAKEFPAFKDLPFALGAAITPVLMMPGMALADPPGDFGILQGRTVALIHPAVMAVLFVGTAWAGWLGWNWRRVRTVGNEISELKASVKSMVAASGEAEAVAPPEIQKQIDALAVERKELVAGDFKNRHTNWGNILLAIGVLISVEGGVNTWMRTGKLFPGPHLFAGAGITVLWALAASLTSEMQKGNETARNLHIFLNCINLALFAWQVPTGLDIVYKVFEFTSWP
mmetsp:Transcript_10433/g.33726  ORF Transcript_10433/g.33726 Transcript_10433/m.33726 type:complete len:302 (+) Transcript_10433:208-1113(+)|eukprot:CAMPEP_0182853444 /NCGR_PEP_ID=MMETSP0034_2-20130328/700_1 /TAXON_ID=156128 /ORGANISM="Nephroselmis pyriformis, Strain CCMP717" /LENGTH=301 /DNA_ID=CAMNT_0024984215 /DNA_START=165 /DNA_END=1070 /DNA_ORIENTATION=+